jgi:hypothetical protein
MEECEEPASWIRSRKAVFSAPCCRRELKAPIPEPTTSNESMVVRELCSPVSCSRLGHTSLQPDPTVCPTRFVRLEYVS